MSCRNSGRRRYCLLHKIKKRGGKRYLHYRGGNSGIITLACRHHWVPNWGQAYLLDVAKVWDRVSSSRTNPTVMTPIRKGIIRVPYMTQRAESKSVPWE